MHILGFGRGHKHEHSHEHSHEHTHEHSHSEITPAILLAHMIDHNRNHVNELEGVAATLSGEAKDTMEEAMALLRQGNDKLAEVLDQIKE